MYSETRDLSPKIMQTKEVRSNKNDERENDEKKDIEEDGKKWISAKDWRHWRRTRMVASDLHQV